MRTRGKGDLRKKDHNVSQAWALPDRALKEENV